VPNNEFSMIFYLQLQDILQTLAVNPEWQATSLYSMLLYQLPTYQPNWWMTAGVKAPSVMRATPNYAVAPWVLVIVV